MLQAYNVVFEALATCPPLFPPSLHQAQALVRVRSNVGVPIPLSIGVDMASVYAKTEVTVDRKDVILPPRRTHTITVNAMPRVEDYEVNDDCVLLVGVGSAMNIHKLPIHIRVVRPMFRVVHNELPLEYVLQHPWGHDSPEWGVVGGGRGGGGGGRGEGGSLQACPVQPAHKCSFIVAALAGFLAHVHLSTVDALVHWVLAHGATGDVMGLRRDHGRIALKEVEVGCQATTTLYIHNAGEVEFTAGIIIRNRQDSKHGQWSPCCALTSSKPKVRTH
jgi:hypothetical protein